MKVTIEAGSPSEVAQLLQFIETMNLGNLQLVVDKTPASSADILKTLHRPIKKRLEIDALKKSRNYKGVNGARFNQLANEMNITEPIELLISQLSQ
jgi:hypothetical protein